MCYICLNSPCLPGCPNADEPEAIFYCECCGEPIVEGDEYYEMDGYYYHEECFRDNAVEILLEIGATHGFAEG